MSASLLRGLRALAAIGCLGAAFQAQAIPAFARKYGTSCQTCHTVYPKLTPFGEAFRRNGYRFPGIDSDITKKESVPLGQDAAKQTFPNSVWPSSLPIDVPLAFGFNGQATLHPDSTSSGGAADNGSTFTMNDLVAEAHMWAGGSFDDKTTFWGELTFSPEGVEIEHAKVLFNDIAGPAHALNAIVGKGAASLTSFGPHSSYVGDALMVNAPVTALYGASSDSWSMGSYYNGVEVNGVLMGRFIYAVGLNAGANLDIRPTENAYAHVGYKLGGMALDGEGASGPADPARPWEENAVTLDAFAYRSYSHYSLPAADATSEPPVLADTGMTFGGGLRAQYGSLELNAGFYQETHSHVATDGSGATLMAQYDELSYVVYPWLVPAVRFEYLSLKPDAGEAMTNLRIMPGVAMLIRPNLKLTVVAQLESAHLAPPGGWGPAGGTAAPAAGSTDVGMEIEGISIGLFTAF